MTQRLSLAVSLVVLAGMSVIALLSLQTFNAQLGSIIFSEQDRLVDRMASNIDQRITLLQNTLTVTASHVEAADLTTPERAQAVLRRNDGLAAVFDRSVFLFSADGKLLAERPYRTDRLGQDATWRPYIRKTLDTRKPVISEPFVTNVGDRNVVLVLTAPVLARDGSLLGILTGSIGLSRPDLLGNVERTRIGQTGYLALTTADGKVIMARDKKLLSEPLFAKGRNELFDRAMAGMEGAARTLDVSGKPAFVTYKRLQNAGWLLSSVYPEAEAYDYVRHLVRDYVVVLGLFIVLVLVVTLGVTGRILSPLRELVAHIGAYSSADGRLAPMDVQDAKGEMALLIQSFNDLTERLHEREVDLMAAMSQYKVITETSTDLISKHDVHGVIRFASPGSRHVLGLAHTELVGTDWLDRVHPEDLAEVRRAFLDVGAGAPPATLAYRVTSAAGRHVWLESTQCLLQGDDGDIEILCISRNIDERKGLEERLYREARMDALTGLPNRLVLEESLCEIVSRARRQESQVAVLLLDIDRFKEINDTLGHRSGDAFIARVADRLKGCSRAGEVLTRWGGDEFVLVLADIPGPEAAVAFAARCNAALCEPFDYEGLKLRVTASIGVALLGDDTDSGDALIVNADIAMYRAKQRGGNQAVLYSKEMNEGAHLRLSMENALFGAVERNEFELHYQPLICARTGRVSGVEALLRWTHPIFGRVSPGLFIPLAEKSGAILEIGEWVLTTACQQMADWHRAGFEGMSLSVNVSGRQFKEGRMLPVVRQALDRSGLQPQSLQLEITESVLMDDMEASRDLLLQLKALGVSIALDDFGTGYSSLSYLKRFALDVIKIDKSFTDDMLDNAQTQAIVRATLDMARSMGLRTVAEGVERLPQAKSLTEQGCDRLQGFYFAKPMPAADTLNYFRTAPIFLIVGRPSVDAAAV